MNFSMLPKDLPLARYRRDAWFRIQQRKIYLSVLAVAAVLAPIAGCQKQAPLEPEAATLSQDAVVTIDPDSAPQASENIPPPRSAAIISPRSSAETAVATPEVALEKLVKNSNLIFPPNTKVFSHSDGGVPDPSIGFYEWVIVSPAPLALPSGRQVGDSEVLSLPMAEAVRFVESKTGGASIENPQAAFSTAWQANGFEFSGTWLRAQGADYLIVQQTRR